MSSATCDRVMQLLQEVLCETVFFGGMGEPLMHPEIYQMISAAKSGGAVTMTVFTDLCGMQVYAGNFLGGDKGKDGAVYNRRNGICFETQGWPNACNTPSFPNTVYTAGEVFESSTSYVFDI